MSEHLALAVVMLSAIAYTVGSLCFKAALTRGVSVWQIALWCNVGMAVLYLPFWAGTDVAVLRAQALRPAIVAVLFFLGQILTFLALRFGDVSVATPMLGAKVVLVPMIAAGFFLESFSTKWWLAAALGTCAVVIVSRSVPARPAATGGSRGGVARPGGRMLPTVASSLGAAAVFALTDVLFQHWSRPTGVAGFIAAMYSLLGVLSVLVYLPVFGRGLLTLPTTTVARNALLLGCLLQAGQNLVMSLVLRFHGHATAVNVVYSSRCVWSVVLAWFTARWVGGTEDRLPPGLLWMRLGGAGLLLVAICLVMLSG